MQNFIGEGTNINNIALRHNNQSRIHFLKNKTIVGNCRGMFAGEITCTVIDAALIVL